MSLIAGPQGSSFQSFSQFNAVAIPIVRLASGGFKDLMSVRRSDLAKAAKVVLTCAAEFRRQGHGEGDGISEYAFSRVESQADHELSIVVESVAVDLSDGVDDTIDVLTRRIEEKRNAWVAKELSAKKPDQRLIDSLRGINIPEATRGAISLRRSVRDLLGVVDPEGEAPEKFIQPATVLGDAGAWRAKFEQAVDAIHAKERTVQQQNEALTSLRNQVKSLEAKVLGSGASHSGVDTAATGGDKTATQAAAAQPSNDSPSS